jgi:hypothetical protein
MSAIAMLAFVICGVEHSGTTLVSDLFRQHPGLDSGFETGVLLASSPRGFLEQMPFALNILGGWSITQEELEACCDTDSFPTFYDRLAKVSRCLELDCRHVFDKTPRYLAHLPSCLERTPVPFIATYKDPRSIVFSDYLRAGKPAFDAWFEAYAGPKLGYMQHLHAMLGSDAAAGPRVLRVRLETLCLQPHATCEAIFAHCGYAFSAGYLSLRNLRYHHTRATTISARIPFEYREHFTTAQCRKIANHFAVLDSWFYDEHA